MSLVTGRHQQRGHNPLKRPSVFEAQRQDSSSRPRSIDDTGPLQRGGRNVAILMSVDGYLELRMPSSSKKWDRKFVVLRGGGAHLSVHDSPSAADANRKPIATIECMNAKIRLDPFDETAFTMTSGRGKVTHMRAGWAGARMAWLEAMQDNGAHIEDAVVIPWEENGGLNDARAAQSAPVEVVRLSDLSKGEHSSRRAAWAAVLPSARASRP